MSDCLKYQELICALIDEELNSRDRAALMAHIAKCPECRQMYLAFSAVSDAVSGDLEEVPEALHENIMASVRRSAIISKNKRRSTRQFKSLIVAAACFAVVVASAFGISSALDDKKANVITDRQQLAAFDAGVDRHAASASLPAPQAASEALITEEPQAAPAKPSAAPEAARPAAAPEVTQDPRQSEYYSTGPRAPETPKPVISAAPITTPKPEVNAGGTQAQGIPVIPTPVETPTAQAEQGQTTAEPQPEPNEAAAAPDEAPAQDETMTKPASAPEAQSVENSAAEAPTEEASANAEAAAESAAAGHTAEDGVAAAKPEEAAPQKKNVILEFFKNNFGRKSNSSAAAVPADTAQDDAVQPSAQPTPKRSGIMAFSSTPSIKLEEEKKADVYVSLSDSKAFEDFSALLLGELSKLPEGKPDKTYLFKTTHLDKDKNFGVMVYAYGDELYFSIYDELIEQNVYLADCTQKKLEDFISANTLTVTPTPAPVVSIGIPEIPDGEAAPDVTPLPMPPAPEGQESNS